MKRAAVEGAILGDFDPDRYKTGNDKKLIASFRVVPAVAASELELAAEQGRIIAEAQNFTSRGEGVRLQNRGQLSGC